MPILSFRGPSDPDEKRKEILWTAIGFAVIFASWLAVVLVFGFQPLILGMTYDEAVLVTGLGLLIICSILYLIGKEREQRYTNQRLLAELHDTVANLDERVRQLNSLCDTSARLVGSLDLDSVSQCALSSLLHGTQGDGSWLVLADERTGQPVYARHSDNLLLTDEASPPYPDHVWPLPFTGADSRLTDPQAQVEAWNRIPHVIAAPLYLKSGLVGVLGAYRDEDKPAFTDDDLSLLTTLANMTAKAMESAQLHSELRDSYLATIRSLVRSLGARDDYSASHGHRVASLAINIAEHMGLPEADIRDIEVFAPVHDVGKIGIRDAILLKPGPLSPEERAVCREHCSIGERIIRPLKPSPGALALVRNHHESWDGRGYPDGLAAEGIPLLARILRVADSYDALIRDRPYGDPMSEEEALAHFALHAGLYYDPAVVAALRAVVRGDEFAPLPAEPEPAGPTAPRALARTSAARASALQPHARSPHLN